MNSCKCFKSIFLFCFVTEDGWCYVKITDSLDPKHFLEIDILQITEYEMVK